MEAAFRLRALPESVATARSESRVFLSSLPVSSEPALLIVSELVSNAVRHGIEPIGLRLVWDGHELNIEVSDCDPRLDRVTTTPALNDDDHGRGLALLDQLASSWGVDAGPSGLSKTVWATLSEDPARPL
jgi:anti-sigma regulatory factor (Ser/Thr protein kinase)